MEEAKKGIRLNTIAMILIGSVVVIVCLIAGIGIFPTYMSLKKANQNIERLSLTLETQKRLFPVYAKAQTLAQLEFLPELQTPVRESLDRRDISTLSQTFDQLAIQHQLIPTGNSLDVNKISEPSSQEKVSVDLHLSGRLFNFRDYLVAVCSLSFFDVVEHIRIEPTDQENKQFIIKVRINIDKGFRQ